MEEFFYNQSPFNHVDSNMHWKIYSIHRSRWLDTSLKGVVTKSNIGNSRVMIKKNGHMIIEHFNHWSTKFSNRLLVFICSLKFIFNHWSVKSSQLYGGAEKIFTFLWPISQVFCSKLIKVKSVHCCDLWH